MDGGNLVKEMVGYFRNLHKSDALCTDDALVAKGVLLTTVPPAESAVKRANSPG